MIANDAPGSTYGTAARFKEATMASGYHLRVKDCQTDGKATRLLVTNEGIAPLYRDAFFAVGTTRAEESLKGLLPNEEKWFEIKAALKDADDLTIVSDNILDSQEIEFDADVEGVDAISNINFDGGATTTLLRLDGTKADNTTKGIIIENKNGKTRKILR